jgi:hypothetical protein
VVSHHPVEIVRHYDLARHEAQPSNLPRDRSVQRRSFLLPVVVRGYVPVRCFDVFRQDPRTRQLFQ